MKIRNGFVSNSSSSSFVVAFPKRPKNIHECHEMMFGPTDWNAYVGTVNGFDLGKYEAAVAVFKEIGRSRSWSKKKVVEHLGSDIIIEFSQYGHVYPEMPLVEVMYEEEQDKKIVEHCNEVAAVNKDIVDLFFDNNSGCFVFQFTYGDENGRFWARMEHSGIFDNLPHLTISLH
jgi:hypothetical protein